MNIKTISLYENNYDYGIISFHVYYLCFCKYIYTVEVNTFQASSEILLVSKENFCKVAHSSNKDSKMHIQLIILAGKMNSASEKLKKKIINAERTQFFTKMIFTKSIQLFCAKYREQEFRSIYPARHNNFSTNLFAD